VTQIRVDVEVLRAAIRTYAETAQHALGKAHEVIDAVEGASGYDGQLRAQVTGIAGQAGPGLRAFAEHMADLTTALERVADGFEIADSAQVAGLAGVAASFRTMIDGGYAAADLPLWLVDGERPPWMSLAEWTDLAVADRQEAYLFYLQQAWASFVSGELTFSHGSQQDMLDAFRVHLFLEGVTTVVPAYGDWESAAVAAGLSLEGYVMHVLDITPYERDTVAGVGLIESRQVGPLATLLVGQSYYNRLYDGHWEDLEKAKSTFAGGSLGGVYYGHDWQGYTQAALGETGRGNFSYTYEQLLMTGAARESLDGIASMATAAAAAQDGAWRLVAGYRLASEHGASGVTFFLNDPDSVWWKYNQDLMDNGFLDYSPMRDLESQYQEHYTHFLEGQGLSPQQVEAAIQARLGRAIFPELAVPDNLDTALELVEKSHADGSVYEMNPEYQKFTEWDIRRLQYGFEAQVDAELAEYRALLMQDRPDIAAAELARLEEVRRAQLQVIMPRYLYEAYLDGTSPAGRDYWDSLIVVQNGRTETAFVTFFTPDATGFFPSH